MLIYLLSQTTTFNGRKIVAAFTNLEALEETARRLWPQGHSPKQWQVTEVPIFDSPITEVL